VKASLGTKLLRPLVGGFRSFLLGALDHFLAHAAECARSGRRGGGRQQMFLDDGATEGRYQLAVPGGIMAEKVFEAHCAARPADVNEELASHGPR
jgi:hypothetical protein